MKNKIIALSLVLVTGIAIFLVNPRTSKLDLQKDKKINKDIGKKEKEVFQIQEVREVLKKEITQKGEQESLPKELETLGIKIDEKTKKLKVVIKKMTDAMMEQHVDQEEINALEKEFNLLGKELKKEVQLYQKLTWIEMRKLDPYKNELVKEWKRREGANI
ncbi:MAG: hypothetical protein NXH75_06565 [Halobacteriovoraceae bacterium]|nr:hypothetical protein [Halobacteriovoraceae bacterium]